MARIAEATRAPTGYNRRPMGHPPHSSKRPLEPSYEEPGGAERAGRDEASPPRALTPANGTSRLNGVRPSRLPAPSRLRPPGGVEDETEWILRIQAGDRAAFQALVERYEGRAFWVAFHMVGQAEDAQDIVQEAFIRVYRAMPTFRVGQRFYTWFYQILLHLAIDHLRKRREVRDLSGEAGSRLEARGPEPADLLEKEEAAERVQSLLASLPARERAILILRDIEDFSGKEIAEIVHSNHSTVRWWLFLARKRFRREWERRYGREDPCG
jgi:RNA polymerase sigma-70 factor, ECF subfamily